MIKTSRSLLERAFKNACRIPFNNESKLILFSDLHRGDNSFADDFAKNRFHYHHALEEYFKKGYTCIEMGDNNELWKVKDFQRIFSAHKNIFSVLKKFHDKGKGKAVKKLYQLWGNHDMDYADPRKVKEHFEYYLEPDSGIRKDFMPELEIHESILLEHEESGKKIFLIHGHQGDWWNYNFWKTARWGVRKFWKNLQLLGIENPTSPASNNKKKSKVEKIIHKWAEDRKLMTVIGHTHRPRMPKPGEGYLFNTGSGVHPRSVTGIEISNGEICLIKWYSEVLTRKEIDSDSAEFSPGEVRIRRKVLAGSHKLSSY